jgi:hypothetical protein
MQRAPLRMGTYESSIGDMIPQIVLDVFALADSLANGFLLPQAGVGVDVLALQASVEETPLLEAHLGKLLLQVSGFSERRPIYRRRALRRRVARGYQSPSHRWTRGVGQSTWKTWTKEYAGSVGF